MAILTIGICPVCLTRRPVKKDGTMGKHNMNRFNRTFHCESKDLKPLRIVSRYNTYK